MRHAFVFEKIAVLIGPWLEPMDPPERGARVEVRMLAEEPARGSRYAAERVVVDRPVFRADLFDQMNAPPGNLQSAHFHPYFDGIEPCDRHWKPEIKRDPTSWLAVQLGDLGAVLERSGIAVAGDAALERDAAALREAMPAITAAVEAAWRAAREEHDASSSRVTT